MQHYSVMLGESLEYLDVRADGIYCDETCGLGGHSGAIAQRLSSGLLIACDRDAESLEIARANTVDCAARIRFHQVLFSHLGEAMAAEGISRLDGLLADL